jgi:16S rRNA G966 N2-methylase RsmD
MALAQCRQVRFDAVYFSRASKRGKRDRDVDGKAFWFIPASYLKCLSAPEIEEAVAQHWDAPASARDMCKVAVTHKFWLKRHLLWSIFPKGLSARDALYGPVGDNEAFFSVTPEPLARHTAATLAHFAETTGRKDGVTVLDLFCGCGGDTIASACSAGIKRVVAIEINPTRLASAAHNARAYGVADRVSFVLGDTIAFLAAATSLLTLPSSARRPTERSRRLWVRLAAQPLGHIYAVSDLSLALGDVCRPIEGPCGLVELAEDASSWHCIDVAYVAPPWGGVDYRREQPHQHRHGEGDRDEKRQCGAASPDPDVATEALQAPPMPRSSETPQGTKGLCSHAAVAVMAGESKPSTTSAGHKRVRGTEHVSVQSTFSLVDDIAIPSPHASALKLTVHSTLSSVSSTPCSALSASSRESADGFTLLAAALLVCPVVGAYLPRSVDQLRIATDVAVLPYKRAVCFEELIIGTGAVPVAVLMYATLGPEREAAGLSSSATDLIAAQ